MLYKAEPAKQSFQTIKTYSSCLNNTIPVSSSFTRLLWGNLFLCSCTSGLS